MSDIGQFGYIVKCEQKGDFLKDIGFSSIFTVHMDYK